MILPTPNYMIREYLICLWIEEEDILVSIINEATSSRYWSNNFRYPKILFPLIRKSSISTNKLDSDA